MKEQQKCCMTKKRKRPAPSQTSVTSCPWWNRNNTEVGDKRRNESISRCNTYGLYQYILSHHDEKKQIDLSFWPVNDHDLQELMKMIVTMPTPRAESTANIITNKNKSDIIHSIQSLTFHFCSYLTDRGIDYLATYWEDRGSGRGDLFKKSQKNYCGDDNLEHRCGKKVKDLKEAEKGTEVDLHQHIVDTCMIVSYRFFNQPLLYLDLSNCSNLTDITCKVIGTHFTKLQSLNISNCVRITDAGFRYIMDGCKYIHEIHLRNLENLQDKGLGFLRRNLVLMKLLRIIG